MLVLAMEFSRGAQRTPLNADHQRTDRCKGALRTGERPAARHKGGPASRRRVGIAAGCSVSRNRGSLPQNGIVMPTAIHRAHRPHERDIRRCAVRQGRDMGDSE